MSARSRQTIRPRSHAVRDARRPVAAGVPALIGVGAASADALITGRDVKNGSLTSADLLDGSLTGRDIRNGTIGTRDLQVGRGR